MKTVAAALLLALAACHHTRHTLTPDVPTSGDASARQRFQEARAKFLRDGGTGQPFSEIADDFPDDPIVPWADLYAGIADVKARQLAKADAELQHVIDRHADPRLTARATLYLGFTKAYEGDAAAARTLLARAAEAVDGDDERTEYLAAISYATAAGDHPLAALRGFDELYGRVTPLERAAIVGRIEVVVAAADPQALQHAFDDLTDRRGPSYAIAASRLAGLAASAGDEAGAAKLRDAAAPARAAVGLPRALVDLVPEGSSEGGLVGALLPLANKKDARIADSAVAGLGLAAGATGGGGVAAIEVRAADSADAAAAAVDALAAAGVIAIVGPLEAVAVDAAGERADALGVPLLSLNVHPEKLVAHKTSFHLRHSPLARARILARRALAAGVTTFAVTGPDNPYGKEVTEAFAVEVDKGGGQVVATSLYPNKSKSFAGLAGKLPGDWQAIFVADSADSLELIAPALATAGDVPRPVGSKKKIAGGRPVLLLSTAEALADSNDFIATTGRYALGALLAPGWCDDEADPTSKDFADRFAAAYGHRPGAGEAYAYDAARLAASAGAGGRARLLAGLATAEMPGVTGAIRFDAAHLRADPGNVYTVIEDGGAFAIRLAK